MILQKSLKQHLIIEIEKDNDGYNIDIIFKYNIHNMNMLSENNRLLKI